MKPGLTRGVPSLLLGVLLLAPALAAAGDYPIQPVPFTQVRLADRFWQPRLLTNARVTIPYAFKKCEETGRISNFEVAGKLKVGAFMGRFPFDDSDVYKIIEGAAYSLQVNPDPKLEKYVDAVIAKIAAAQEDDGYLMTWRTIDATKPPTGWSGTAARWSDIKGGHELYNMGHLYEAAVAFFQATGKHSLLDVAVKSADLIDRTFGPGKRMDVPGHEEVEIGLFKLYRVTKNARYLELARFFIDQRGNASGHKLYGEYAQDHKPVLEQSEGVGHAVRAGYLYSGVADLVALTGDAAYGKALGRIWDNVVNRKIYLTGGIGSRHQGEAFGDDYELPNMEAYNETCAAIANVFWNHRMFLLEGDARYIDVLEQTLYNGVLAGIGIDGESFFYPNPLESDGVFTFNQGSCTRKPWFDCSCCPSNATRFVPSIPGYVYAVRDNELYANLYVNGTAKVKLGDVTVQLEQVTDYPWDGRVQVKVKPGREHNFALLLRIPGWTGKTPLPGQLYHFLDAESQAVTVKVNGKALAPLSHSKGYVRIERTWKPGDTVHLSLPMRVRVVRSDSKVAANVGRVALQRGPIVYCAENADNPAMVRQISLSHSAQLRDVPKKGLLNGVVTIEGDLPGNQSVVFIPYYAWAHRGAGEMRVWIPESR